MTPSMLEQAILCKPYFDRQGMIVAVRDQQLVGFVHAGFGPADKGAWIARDLGVTCMLMVRPEEAERPLAADLLAHSEEYLRRLGAKVLYAGGIYPLNPFYLGLAGGSELAGVLDSDASRQAFYRSQAYVEIDRVVVLHCDLGAFRPPANRQQLQLRRRVQVEIEFDPCTKSWWEACTLGGLERVRFQMVAGEGGPPLATTTLWDMEPLASSWGVRASGLLDLEVDQAYRRQGLATLLLAETFRQLQLHGVSCVEAQAMAHNHAALALYRRLGFVEIDQGAVLRKA